MGYFERDGEEEAGLVASMEGDGVYDGRTPLDRTIDRIGMGALCSQLWRGGHRILRHWYLGSYQWTLLSLCGFGESHSRDESSLIR